MKTITTILFLITNLIFSQEPDPYSFFPSSIGNVWEYNSIFGFAREEIYKDSTDNEKLRYLYYKYNDYFTPTPQFKIDSISFTVFYIPYNLDWIYYKLNAHKGDFWIVSTNIYENEEADTIYTLAIVRDKYVTTIFGRPTTIMEIRYIPDQPDTIIDEGFPGGFVDYLASGIGLVQRWDVEGGPTMVLKGCIIDGDTIGTIITSINEIAESPFNYKLYQNYPNPFNPSTIIRYSIPKAEHVKITIYSLLGEEIVTLVENYQAMGIHEVEFNANFLASGVYIYRITAGYYSSSKKLTLLKLCKNKQNINRSL